MARLKLLQEELARDPFWMLLACSSSSIRRAAQDDGSYPLRVSPGRPRVAGERPTTAGVITTPSGLTPSHGSRVARSTSDAPYRCAQVVRLRKLRSGQLGNIR